MARLAIAGLRLEFTQMPTLTGTSSLEPEALDRQSLAAGQGHGAGKR
jgi:hypothetical protein